MIVFFNKKTGEIVGTIRGRKHSPVELNMTVGENPEENDKIVVEWEPTGEEEKRIVETEQYVVAGIDDEGKDLYKKRTVKKEVVNKKFTPDHPQAKLFSDIENDAQKIYNYKIKNGRLVEK